MKAKKIEFIIILYLAFFCSLAGLFFLLSTYDFIYIIFGDRDFLRAALPWSEIPPLGPELTGKGRIPGGFFYYILHPLLKLTGGPYGVHLILLASHLLAGGLLFQFLRKYSDLMAAWIGLALFLCQHLLVPEILYIWNPSLAPLLAVGCLWGGAKVFVDRKAIHLTWLFPLVGIAAQVHFSFISLLPLFFVMILWKRPAQWPPMVAIGFLFLGLVYTPYFWSEWQSGFANAQALKESSDEFSIHLAQTRAFFMNLYEFLGGLQSNWQNRVPNGSWFERIRYFAVAPWVLTTLIVWFVSLEKGLKNPRIKNLVIYCSLIVLGGFALIYFSGTFIRTRRVIYLVPFLQVIFAITFADMIEHLKVWMRSGKRSKLVTVLLMVFMGWHLGFHLSLAAYEQRLNIRYPWQKEASLFTSYRDYLEVVEGLKKLEVNQSQVRYGLGFTERSAGGAWLWSRDAIASIYNTPRFAFDYLSERELIDDKEKALPLKHCIAVARVRDLWDSPEKVNLGLDLLDENSRTVHFVHQTRNFAFFRYDSWHGNCLRKINNRFWPNTREKNLTLMNWSGEIPISYTPTLYFGLNYQRDESGEIYFHFESNELRGYNGSSRYWMPGLQVRLVGEQEDHVFTLVPSFLDSLVTLDHVDDNYYEHSPFLTPYWSERLAIPSGEYEVFLEARELRARYTTHPRVIVLPSIQIPLGSLRL